MEVLLLITVWILSALSFAVGYYTGSGRKPKEIIEKVKREIRKKTIPSGPVMRPGPETVNKWANTAQEAEDEEFKKSFLKQHPEAKEFI